MALTMEDLKPKLDEALQFLNTCDSTAANMGEFIHKLDDQVKKLHEDHRKEFTAYLCKQGYGRQFGKMWKALSGYLKKDKWEEDGFQILCSMMSGYFIFVFSCTDLAAQVVNQDILCILASIDELRVHYEGKDSHEPIDNLMFYMFGIIYSSVSMSSNSKRKLVREHNAVEIFEKYLKSQHDGIRLLSLMTLAYIVDESESNILATSDGGVASLVEFLEKSMTSSSHASYQGMLTARQILDCLNRLAINDTNKRVIQKAGGIPIMIRMLQDSFNEEEQCAAAKALWNLAFIESIRKSPELQEAVPCK